MNRLILVGSKLYGPGPIVKMTPAEAERRIQSIIDHLEALNEIARRPEPRSKPKLTLIKENS